jgi:predicted RNase H-like HicB family nuclease
MGKYEIIIFWSEEDKSYVAEVPELSGCMADDTTYQDALSNAEPIIREWIETASNLGRAIPKPRGHLWTGDANAGNSDSWRDDARTSLRYDHGINV